MPQRRRVLGARHRDVHDPRRHLHAPLRLLQRQDRQADLERPARARARRALGRAHGPAPRGHHLRRPRRPPRPRQRGVRRRDRRDPPPGARMPDRGAHARLPGPGDAARARDRGPPRRLQPQRRGRAPAVPAGAARLGVPALRARAAQREGAGRRRGHDEVGADGRARRDPRGDGRDVRPAARARRPGADGRAVPAAQPASTCRSSASGIRTSSRRSSAPPTRSASSTSPPARSCAPPTTPTSTCRSRARASGRSPLAGDPAARQHPPRAAAGRHDRADRRQRASPTWSRCATAGRSSTARAPPTIVRYGAIPYELTHLSSHCELAAGGFVAA